MVTSGFCLFETALGVMGVIWGEHGILSVQLPEGSEPATRARIARRFPRAEERQPPAPVGRAAEGIVALLRGERIDLSAMELDLDQVPAFERQVYRVVRTIPPGSTLSYGEVATRLGQPGAGRAVGRALGRNPWAILVPCHRVLAASGRLGGFSARGGRDTKRRLLAIEQRHGEDPLGLFAEPGRASPAESG